MRDKRLGVRRARNGNLSQLSNSLRPMQGSLNWKPRERTRSVKQWLREARCNRRESTTPLHRSKPNTKEKRSTWTSICRQSLIKATWTSSKTSIKSVRNCTILMRPSLRKRKRCMPCTARKKMKVAERTIDCPTNRRPESTISDGHTKKGFQTLLRPEEHLSRLI